MSIALFEIVGQLKEFDALTESEDIPAEVIRDTLEGLEGSFEAKAVNVAKFILELESRADAIAEVAKIQADRARRIQKRADAVRAYLLFNFQALDKKRLECADLVIRRQNNPAAVQVTDEKQVPVNYWFTPPPPPPQLDKKAIKKALEDGAEIPGVFLEQGEHLRIVL